MPLRSLRSYEQQSPDLSIRQALAKKRINLALTVESRESGSKMASEEIPTSLVRLWSLARETTKTACSLVVELASNSLKTSRLPR